MATETLELTIRQSNGTRFSVVVGEISPADCTVRRVKEALVEHCPVERQRLIYKGKILDDQKSLHDYGIVTKSTLFLVKGGAATTSAPPAPAAGTSAASSPGATAGNSASATNPPSAAAFANAFPSAPPSASNPTSHTTPWAAAAAQNANPWMAGGGAGMMSPQQMEQMMNNPLVSSLLDNPQTLQSIMEMQMQSNPQMRQMMENNPMIREMFNDPAVLRQAVEMMRNPAARQQAMRNQDLAMSNIENMPGGFAALSNMYRDVQLPLEESMMGGAASSSSNTNNAANSNAGATGSAMPNPWGSSTSQTSSGQSSSGAPPNPFAAMMGGNSNRANPLASSNPWAAASGGAGSVPPQPSMDQMNAAISMMENPMIQQMMDQTMSQNPEFFRNMLAAQNPMLGQMFQNNPEAANNFLRTMMNPQVMRSMMQLQQAMGGVTGNPAMPPLATPGNSAGMPPPPSGLDFASLFQSMNNANIGGLSATSSPPPQNPADRYRNQLRSLYDMGFDDEQQSLAALQAAHGNLNRAVDMLLAGDVPASPVPAASSGDNSNNNDIPPPSEPKDSQDKKND